MKEYDEQEWESVAARLLLRAENGKIPHSGLSEIACELGVSQFFVERVWRRVRAYVENGLDYRSRNSQCSLARIDGTELASELEKLPLTSRRTIRDVALALGVSTTSVNAPELYTGNGLKMILIS